MRVGLNRKDIKGSFILLYIMVKEWRKERRLLLKIKKSGKAWFISVFYPWQIFKFYNNA